MFDTKKKLKEEVENLQQEIRFLKVEMQRLEGLLEVERKEKAFFEERGDKYMRLRDSYEKHLTTLGTEICNLLKEPAMLKVYKEAVATRGCK